MAIGRIEPISSATPSTTVTSVSSASKNLQNQLLIKQQNLKKLSSDSKLSADEKEKQRLELQKEIEELKRKLEQMRLKQEETQKAEEAKQKKEVELEKAVETQEEKKETEATASSNMLEDKNEEIKLSANEVQKMLDTKLFLKEEMVQQGVEYDKKNTVRVLSSEIRQDEIHGSDTSEKKEELKELMKEKNFWTDAKYKDKEPEIPPIIHPDMQVVIDQ